MLKFPEKLKVLEILYKTITKNEFQYEFLNKGYIIPFAHLNPLLKSTETVFIPSKSDFGHKLLILKFSLHINQRKED